MICQPALKGKVRRIGGTLKTIFTVGICGTSHLPSHKGGFPCRVNVFHLSVNSVGLRNQTTCWRWKNWSIVGDGVIFPGKMMTMRTKPPWVFLSSYFLGPRLAGIRSECGAVWNARITQTQAVNLHPPPSFRSKDDLTVQTGCHWTFYLKGILNLGSARRAQCTYCRARVWHSTLRTPISSVCGYIYSQFALVRIFLSQELFGDQSLQPCPFKYRLPLRWTWHVHGD